MEILWILKRIKTKKIAVVSPTSIIISRRTNAIEISNKQPITKIIGFAGY